MILNLHRFLLTLPFHVDSFLPNNQLSLHQVSWCDVIEIYFLLVMKNDRVFTKWLLKKNCYSDKIVEASNEIMRNCKSVDKLLAGSVEKRYVDACKMKERLERTRKWWARWGMNGGMSTLSATGVQVLFAGTVSRKAHRIQSLDNFRKCYPLSILSTYFPSFFFFLTTFKIKREKQEISKSISDKL